MRSKGEKENVDVAEETEKIIEKDIAQRQQSDKELNKFIYTFGIIGPALAFFQAFRIFSLGEAKISAFYWAAYLIIAGLWVSYGIYYKNRAIVVVYSLWIAVEIIILIGLFS